MAKIRLQRDYRGRASGERFFPEGTYDASELGSALVDYLVSMGWAETLVTASTAASTPDEGKQAKVKKEG